MLMDTIQNTPRQVLCYPPSFDGWLCAVFVAYEQRCTEQAWLVADRDYQGGLFDSKIDITIDDAKAVRVLAWLDKRFGKQMHLLVWAWLSERADIGQTLFGVVRYALANPTVAVLSDHTHPDIIALHKAVRSVGREKHRMEAFVRFEQLTDGLYFARIEPDFDVLPLIADHFKSRYQDQNFAIFDARRGYGLHHAVGGHCAPIVDVDDQMLSDPSVAWSPDEARYQEFWQGYFFHASIHERANPRLHRQHLPRRYWRYLTEKQTAHDADFLHKKH